MIWIFIFCSKYTGYFLLRTYLSLIKMQMEPIKAEMARVSPALSREE
jgi:hypothetical protein